MSGSWRPWRGVFQRDPRAELDEELGHHVEARVRDYMARGMDEASARRAAHERLGDLERARAECATLLSAERRAHERRVRVNVSWLDVKLGLRMLRKNPGLSVVAVLGMAVAIAIGSGYFAGFGAVIDPVLPLADGDRMVGLRYQGDRPGNDAEVSVHDYFAWSAALGSVEELSAFRSQTRNLVTSEGRVELVEVAAITARGLRLSRVSPAQGRLLLDEDERAGAAPVLLIAHEEWQRVFDGEPDIVGRTVRLGDVIHTIVGVMPEGFRFPINHRYWVPLPLSPAAARAGDAPSVLVFGRLQEGVSLGRARTEVEAVGERISTAQPATHANLRPTVLPYTHAMFGVDGPEVELAVRAFQLAVSLLLVIVALNVAVLIYARTVTRTGEIAVRSALGASRRRVVTQLFVEGLVLSVVAAAIGLTLAAVALGLVNDWIARTGEAAFWIELGLSPGAVVYALLLAVLGGAIVGVLPALKATGRRLQADLQQFSSRGSAMQLGRTWTALIILQVALAVAALPAAVDNAEGAIRLGTRAPSAAAQGLLTASVVLQRAEPASARDSLAEQAFRARFADRMAELIRRLEAQPAVGGVTYADRFPGLEGYAVIEIDRTGASTADTTATAGDPFIGTRTSRVGVDLFDVFDVPVTAGRGFVPADTRPGATAVIVSASFAAEIAGGAGVLGRRIRYSRPDDVDPEPWLEIVGVVPDFASEFTTPNSLDPVQPRLFHAADAGDAHPGILVVRVASGSPGTFAGRLRDIAAAIDPTLTLENVESVAAAWKQDQQAIGSIGVMILAVMVSVLLLSAAGIYAMMSFTVAKRRREIGIRSALGADPRRILTGVFARAAAQVGAGIAAGLVIAVAYAGFTGGTGRQGFVLLAVVAAIMLTVGVLAALGPARRGLSIQPTEALRAE